jgi:hypothetical protein
VTGERAEAYAHVLRLLADLGPERLRAAESAAVREAADALVFCVEITSDEEARRALNHLDEVVEGVVEAGRLRAATGEALLEAVEACGPRAARASL